MRWLGERVVALADVVLVMFSATAILLVNVVRERSKAEANVGRAPNDVKLMDVGGRLES